MPVTESQVRKTSYTEAAPRSYRDITPHDRKATKVFELRIYTLTSAAAVDAYAEVHWPLHVASLRRFGIETRGVWTSPEPDVHRLYALVSYPADADPGAVTVEYMSSPDFRTDMEGFDIANIVAVEFVICHEDGTTGWPATMDRLFGSLGMIGGRRLGVN